ncbi:MAG TPA: phenylalanine--tRNA ligase subunit alpha [Acidimicrobiales bacterium]|nr:phenylalanine--tRNA ligase subunit alpha [Acidimicrobiales bacterium]
MTLDPVVRDALAAIEAAGTILDLHGVEAAVLGKRSPLAAESQRLGTLAPDERKVAGQALNEARTTITDALAAHREELTRAEAVGRAQADRLDLTETTPARLRGHLNLVTQARDRLEDVFVGMGYAVAEGPEAETDWHNFTALNLPPAHPARSMWDTLYLDWGPPESTLLRTHTSPVQVRLMQSQPPPIYAVMPGRVYRRDTPDARHTPSFNQIEGLVVDRGITFGHLAGTIEAFTEAYFGPGMHSRLRPSYFPFTEPSAEFEVTCTICAGEGCRTCSNTGWIELGGCGMVHPNVFGHVGVDAETYTGFAFGFGIDRLAQMRHAISDMRILFDNDLRFIRQF